MARGLALISLLFLVLGEVQAQFPRACASEEARGMRRCCPPYQGSPCGVDLNRGDCSQINPPYKFWPPPIYYLFCVCKGNFDGYDCGQCKPGWRGENCTDRQRHVRKEINTLSSEEQNNFFETLQKAKYKISERYVTLTRDFNDKDLHFENDTTYNIFVWMHYYAAKAAADGGHTNAAHNGPAFPLWHRRWLLFMEQEIRDLTGDENFSIPYWDWTKTDHCNICTNELFGESPGGRISENSNFSSWETVCTYDDRYSANNWVFDLAAKLLTDITSILSLGKNVFSPRQVCAKRPPALTPEYIMRSPGTDPGNDALPTQAEVQAVLRTTDYDTFPYDRHAKNSFRNRLEGFDKSLNTRNHLTSAMHNLVHNYFSGTMSDVLIAANDPLFMVHHAMVDRLYEEWLTHHPVMTYPVDDVIPPIQRGYSFMRPFFPPVTNDYLTGVRAEQLGYTYE